MPACMVRLLFATVIGFLAVQHCCNAKQNLLSLGSEYLPTIANKAAIKPFLLASLPPGTLGRLATAVVANCVPAALLARSSQRILTSAGLLHSTLLGVGLWACFGIEGWTVGVAYLALGSLVTKIRLKEKEALGIAEKRGGARGPENVWGSAAVGLLCALLAACAPQYSRVLKVAFVASFASKLSDTFGSELGKAFGTRTFLITSLKPVPRGTEGAVSIEGLVAGVVGSILMAGIARALRLLSRSSDVAVVVGSAFVASTLESVIGATLQTRLTWLSNDVVNGIMTAIGAGVAICWCCLSPAMRNACS